MCTTALPQSQSERQGLPTRHAVRAGRTPNLLTCLGEAAALPRASWQLAVCTPAFLEGGRCGASLGPASPTGAGGDGGAGAEGCGAGCCQSGTAMGAGQPGTAAAASAGW